MLVTLTEKKLSYKFNVEKWVEISDRDNMRELPRSQTQINKGGINSCYVSKTFSHP